MKTLNLRTPYVLSILSVFCILGIQAASGVAMGAQASEENLALKKPVTVSGETQGEATPEKAVDGVPTNDSSWHSGKTPSWLQVDLGKVFPIDHAGVYLYYDGTRYYQYTVETSTDAKAWKQVVDMSANTRPSTSEGNEHFFDRTDARYVRVNLLKNSANPGEHLNELMVFEAGTVPALGLQRDRNLLLGGGDITLRFADSHTQAWDLTRMLTLRDWTQGKDHVTVGKDKSSLTPEQLARIGFVNPSNKGPGQYHAALGADGELVPGDPVVAINPPFDVSNEARAGRAKIYDVKGLANLTGKGSGLKDGMTIDFFGDSITWLGGYIDTIDGGIKAGEGSQDKKVKLVNRGINGGGVLSVLEGSKDSAFPGSSAQKSFAEVIAADKADLAVVYIGVNDVWWRKTAPDVFEKALRDIVATAKANKVTLVLATLSIHGELPNGKNADDAKIEQFAQITRKVAKETNTVLVDLRQAYIAYLQNNNAQLRVDGTLLHADSGILTYDGVHPSDKGVHLLANMISEGIFEALKK